MTATRPYLLDINVLLALAWSSHVHHAQAQHWFVQKRLAGFRTCPLTQIGFVRISINPTFTLNAASPNEALLLLNRITSLPEHDFWPDDLAPGQALGEYSVIGHRQVTDAYLLALALSRSGVLATFDRAVLSLAGSTQEHVELIQGLSGTQ